MLYLCLYVFLQRFQSLLGNAESIDTNILYAVLTTAAVLSQFVFHIPSTTFIL